MMNTQRRRDGANFKAWEIEMFSRSAKARARHYIGQLSTENIKAGYWYYRSLIKRWNKREV
jgi:hypothetical protein